MIRIVLSAAVAGLMSLSMTGAGQAQERTLKRITAGEPAPLQKAMTQSQARRLCQQEMRGARESRSSIRQKMQICMQKKMEGN
ncbi:MAG: hypothetical protein ACK4VM_03650 [Bosea sp. (in: a-proteobacteria)]